MSTAKKLERKPSLMSREDSDKIDIDKKIITETEMKKIDRKWKLYEKNFTKNKINIKNAVENFREENEMSINKSCKFFEISPRHYYRLTNEEENITLETMAQVAASMGKKLRIEFD